MAEILNAATVQQKTRELLGNGRDYSYITDDLVRADAALGAEREVKAEANAILHGNNARYGARVINGTTYQVYYFETLADAYNPNHACGTAQTWWARMDIWHHQYVGVCTNIGRERWQFTQ